MPFCVLIEVWLLCRYVLSSNGSLVIGESFVEDSGVFQCFASNVAGIVMAATWLRVTSK